MIINKNSTTFISGLLAFGIYFILMGLLLFYFNTKEEKKPINYVKKDEKVIQVALSKPQEIVKRKVKDNKSTPKPKQHLKKKAEKKRVEKKKVVKKRVVKKRVIKEKIVKKLKKKKDTNSTKHKKKPIDLFANVKTKKKKNVIELTDKPKKSKPKNNLIKLSNKPKSSHHSNALKNQKVRQSGVEDAYLAKVQSMLEGWPTQSEYAGEKVKVLLYIETDGTFEFELKTVSYNEDFNVGLAYYLEQLQGIGFGPHRGQRTYQFEAEFIAKE